MSLHLTLALVVLWLMCMPSPCNQWYQVKWSAIITSLCCLVFVMWCPQLLLLFPVRSLHHSLVVSCVVIAWLHGVVLFDWVWSECTDSHTQRKKTAHRRACVCSGVVWTVVCEWERRKKSGGMVGWNGERKEWRTRSHKSKKTLFSSNHFSPSFLFSKFFPFLTLSCCLTFNSITQSK